MRSAGSRVNQDEASKVVFAESGIASVARKALTLPLIGSGKLVVFWIVIVVRLSWSGVTTVSRMAGEAARADSLARTTFELEKIKDRVRMANVILDITLL